MLRKLLVVSFVGAVLSLAQPATAGGGWWSYLDVDSPRFSPGQTVEARGEFLFPSIEAAQRARASGHFYVYLVRDFDYGIANQAMTKAEPGDWWRLGDAEPLRVGEVGLDRFNGNLAHASASFVVPEVELGRYVLMFCDAGCAHPLGDFVPTKVRVVDPVEDLRRRLDRLQSRTAERVNALRAELRETQDGAAEVGDVEAAQEVTAVLERRLVLLERRLERLDEDPGTPWAAYVGWLVAGAALGALIVTALTRRRIPEPLIPLDDRQLEKERARELASTRP